MSAPASCEVQGCRCGCVSYARVARYHDSIEFTKSVTQYERSAVA